MSSFSLLYRSPLWPVGEQLPVIGRILWNVSRHSIYDVDNDTNNGRRRAFRKLYSRPLT